MVLDTRLYTQDKMEANHEFKITTGNHIKDHGPPAHTRAME
jgi:hypothetical protein